MSAVILCAWVTVTWRHDQLCRLRGCTGGHAHLSQPEATHLRSRTVLSSYCQWNIIRCAHRPVRPLGGLFQGAVRALMPGVCVAFDMHCTQHDAVRWICFISCIHVWKLIASRHQGVYRE